MPTGYTADVCDGKVTDFKEFAMRCARNFGALISMRDDSLDAKVPEAFKPSDYHDKELAKAHSERDRILKMMAGECIEAEGEARKKNLEAHQKHVDECKAIRDRLMAMRSMAADWVPPTTDHQGMKDFMIEQLDSTLLFDGKPGTYYLDLAKPRSGEEWRNDRIEELNRSIEYHTKYGREEIERTDSCNRWVAALRKSLSL